MSFYNCTAEPQSTATLKVRCQRSAREFRVTIFKGYLFSYFLSISSHEVFLLVSGGELLALEGSNQVFTAEVLEFVSPTYRVEKLSSLTQQWLASSSN